MDSKAWKQYGRFGSVGIELVISIVLGFFGGDWLDKKFNTGPWLAIVGLLVGVYAGSRSIFKAATLMQKEAEREANEEQARLEGGGEPSLDSSVENEAISGQKAPGSSEDEPSEKPPNDKWKFN